MVRGFGGKKGGGRALSGKCCDRIQRHWHKNGKRG